MKRLVLIIALCSLCAIVFADSQVLFDAMEQEINRTMNNLRLDDMEAPYFTQYQVEEFTTATVCASAGAIIKSNDNSYRVGSVNIRVGDYDFDNTNYKTSDIWSLSRQFYVPKENDIIGIRYPFWKKTDQNYKIILEHFTKKKNTLEQVNIDYSTPDFSREEQVEYIEPDFDSLLDISQYEEIARHLSSLIDENKEIQRSCATVIALDEDYLIANSEKTKLKLERSLMEISVYGAVQMDNGSHFMDTRKLYQDPINIEDEASYAQLSIELAKQLEDMKNADTIDYYIGPVLFKNQAASQLFYQVLSQRIVAPSNEISENQRDKMIQTNGNNDFEKRIGKNVAKHFLNIYDDPTVEQVSGTELLGHYNYDDEAVKAQRVNIIEQGTLKGFLMNRKPYKNNLKSNGHGRNQWGRINTNIANLFIESENAISDKDIEDEFVGKFSEEGLEYGLVIERIYNPNNYTGTMTSAVADISNKFKNGMKEMKGSSEINPPLVIYKLYKDGRREYLKDLTFTNLTTRVLRDIEVTSDKQYVDNFAVYNMGVSVIAPSSVIVSDMELTKIDINGDKKPYLSRP